MRLREAAFPYAVAHRADVGAHEAAGRGSGRGAALDMYPEREGR